MPFSSWADTASSSNAVPVASSSNALPLDVWSVSTPSNALPSQEYMETDDFDTLDVPSLLSDGDGSWNHVDSTVIDYTAVDAWLYYYDMSNVEKRVTKKLSSDGYFSFGVPGDCASIYSLRFDINSRALPSTGKYQFQFRFGSNTGIEWKQVGVGLRKIINNANGSSNWTYDRTPFQSSGDFYITRNLNLSGVNQIGLEALFKSTSVSNLPCGGYVDIAFLQLSSSATTNLNGPDSSSTVDVNTDINQNIADNTAQQVEQGDTIIELIKNTIQTISFQLTSFWNQLAGEFTNLYNKMNQQHQESIDKVDEQIDNDNTNTDKVTTAIEAHGNFIIEGLKSLFIPSDEYFKSWFDGMYQFFNDRLGFLMLPVDLLVRMVDIYTSAGSSSAGIPFPEFKWMDGTVIIPAQTVQFDFLNTDWGKGIQDKLYFVGNLIMIGALLSLMHRKFEEVLRN